MYYLFIIVALGLAHTQTSATFAPTSYLHDPSQDCQSKYEYFYHNLYPNKTMHAQYGVTMFVRSEKEHTNALLFHFENYENATRHLSPKPVRVHFDDNGKILKADVHDEDLESSLSLKISLILATQLDWGQVTSALDTKGPLQFKSLMKGKKRDCTIEYDVEIDDSKITFTVVGNRNVTQCTKKCHKDYEKYKESTKTWKFTFDQTKASNFLSLSVDIVDYFSPEHTVTIESGFTYSGCEKYSDVWDTSDLKEDTRDYYELAKLKKHQPGF